MTRQQLIEKLGQVTLIGKGFGVPRNQYSVKGPKARTVTAEIQKHNATVWVGM